jgi:ferredoxin
MDLMNTYIEADADRCTGHARCYLFAAPDLLKEDEEGFVSLRGSRMLVPADQIAEASAAQISCPERAIKVYQESEAP